MIIEELLPQALLDVLDSPEFDDEAGIVIDVVTFTDDNIVARFAVRYYYSETLPLQRQLTVTGVLKERIIGDWTQHIALYNHHPLISEHTDTYSELYFKGNTIQYKELFIDIYEALLPYLSFINQANDYPLTPEYIGELCQQGYGLFARGSQPIVLLYQQCLLKHGIYAYFISEIKPNKKAQNLKLFELGESYIIGQTFTFERI